MTRKSRKKADQRRFSRTAQRTKLMNVNPKFMRGGIRL